MSSDEQDSVFKVVAAILQLGNIKFSAARGEGTAINDRTSTDHYSLPLLNDHLASFTHSRHRHCHNSHH